MRSGSTRSKLTLLFLAFAMVLALPAIALADNTVADGDGLAPVASQNMAMGDVACDVASNKDARIAITRQGNAGSTNVFKNSSTATVTVQSVTGAGLSAQMGASNTITLPSDWSTKSNGTLSNNVSSTVTVDSSVAGAGSGSVTYVAKGVNSDNREITRTDVMNVTWTTGSCTPADTTAPVITKVVTPASPDGSNGWYTSDVTVDWTVSDPESSISSQSGCADFSVTSDQQATTYTCTATSTGGTASQSVTIKRDATAPQISGEDVNDSTWRNSDLSRSFTASDATSGLSNSADASFSLTAAAESANANTPTTDSKTVTDAAGNSATRSLSALIDKTAPSITDDGPTASANNNGWYNSDVTNEFSASDALSGLANAADASIAQSTQGEGRSLKVASGSVADLAGNVAPSIDSRGFDVDKTAPTNVAGTPDRAANSNGWYNGAVTVTFAGEDALSGIANCSSDIYDGPDAGAASVGGSCRDLAGNSSDGSFNLKYDATAPTLAPSVSPNPVLLNGSAVATAGAGDNLSGVASQSCGPVDTGSVGAKSVSCSASDEAGNQHSASASYNVHYDFAGFFRPVDTKDANGNYIVNVAKAGSTIPVKFSLAGNQGLNIFLSGSPSSGAIACDAGAATDAIEETATATNSGLKYDALAGQYVYNWKTESTFAGKCRQLVVKFQDGTVQRANFKFTK